MMNARGNNAFMLSLLVLVLVLIIIGGPPSGGFGA